MFETTNGSEWIYVGKGLYINTLKKPPCSKEEKIFHGSETAKLQVASWLLTMYR